MNHLKNNNFSILNSSLNTIDELEITIKLDNFKNSNIKKTNISIKHISKN